MKMKTTNRKQHTNHNFRKQVFRKVLAFGLSVSLLSAYPLYLHESDVITYASGTSTVLDKESYVKNGAILHCFSWSFETIKERLPEIKQAGFTAIQTSPVNEIASKPTVEKVLMGRNSDGSENGDYGAWWWHYQPTDWKIGNWQLGTKEEFTEMVHKADELGIQVLVDVVPNHTSPLLEQVSPEFVEAVGGWDDMYHENAQVNINQPVGANGSSSISNYNDRLDVTSRCLLGLSDVNTENPRFQAYYLKYLNELIDIGVDGFRYDTGKHIALPNEPLDPKTVREGQTNNFWEVATGRQSANGVRLKNKDNLFIYGEILQDPTIDDVGYTNYVYMTASNYGKKLRQQLATRNPYNEHNHGISSNLDDVYLHPNDLGNWIHGNDNKIVTWVESHDTYFNEGESAHLSDQKIRFGWAAITARAKGTPLFFSRPNGSDGWNNRYGNNVLGAAGNAQFKDPEVREVNLFRQAMIGQPEYLRSHYDAKIYQIDRGTLGTVIINAGEDQNNITFPTTMAEGTYKDHVSGAQFRVEKVGNQNLLKGNLSSGKIAVIYGAEPELSAVNSINKTFFFGPQTEVTLTALNTTDNTYVTNDGKRGSFQSGDKLVLSSDENGTATVTLTGKKKNSEEIITTEINFTQIDKNEQYDVYFEKHSDWDSVGMHAYAENGPTTAWPGERMIHLGYGVYGAKIPQNIKDAPGNTQIIFAKLNGNGNAVGGQDPQTGSLTFDDTSINAYFYDKTKEPYSERWKPVNSHVSNNQQPLSVELTVEEQNPKEGNLAHFTATASGGAVANYEYKFSVRHGSEVLQDSIQDFDANNTFSWVEQKPGIAYITVEARVRDTDQVAAKTIAQNWLEEEVIFNRDYDVYFKKPAGWRRDSLHVYAYEAGGTGKNAPWPGKPFDAYVNGDVYGYKLPAGMENYLIVFNDAVDGSEEFKKQYPYDSQPGLPAVKGGSMYLNGFGTLDTGAWKMVAKDPIIQVDLTKNLESPQPQNTEVVFSASASGGAGTLQYRFSKAEGIIAPENYNNTIFTAISEEFGNDNTLRLSADTGKTYTIKVEVKDNSSAYNYSETENTIAVAYTNFTWEAERNEQPGDGQQPPQGDGQQSPQGDGQQSPQGDGQQPPLGDGQQPPLGDGQQPPQGDGQQSPQGDGQQSPQGGQTTPPQGEPTPQNNQPQVATPSNAGQSNNSGSSNHNQNLGNSGSNNNQNSGNQHSNSTVPDTNRNYSKRSFRLSGSIRKLASLFVGQLHYVSTTNFWFKQNNKWTAMDKDGDIAINTWKHYEWLGNKDWYYFDVDGFMLTDWHWIEGKCYYFDTSGKLLMNTITPDGYQVNENGEWVLNNIIQTH